MLFNSYLFIFFFAPITFAVYFILNRKHFIFTAKSWLILASFFFYGYWNPFYVPLLLGSLLFNYAIGVILTHVRKRQAPSRLMLLVGVGGNLSLLVYFKYMDFFITNINAVTPLNLELLHITLPLGISFFTFTQIAYLVDMARETGSKYSLLNYALFVTFFPRLLMGPIIRPHEMIPQFDAPETKVLNYKHIAQGLSLFFLGLFKKVIIADTLAGWANAGFDHMNSLALIEAWMTSLSYTLQLYYDFSGYTDMAIGASLLFNIKLPINFNSPYKSLTIQEFWRRWHMTLSRFVRDYIYIPLGGSRVPDSRILINMLITFFMVGLWHGAGWTFVIWGLLHGCALVVFHFWRKTPFRLPRLISWIITFNFVNAAWVFFRAQTFSDAMRVLKGMVGLTGIILPEKSIYLFAGLKQYGIQFGDVLMTIGWSQRTFSWIIVCFFLAIFFKNSNEIVEQLKPTWRVATALSLISLYAISNLQRVREFIYFVF